MQPRILFLTLKVFSVTGGIEKVCRVAGKAFCEIAAAEGGEATVFSMYDATGDLDSKYFPASSFKGFKGKKLSFVFQSIAAGRKADVVILSHINLLSVGYAIKKLLPSTKVILLAHGIEVWQPLPSWKKKLLYACDLVLPVSNFTKEKMKELYGLAEDRLRVVNNCLDPFLQPPQSGPKNEALLERYGLTANDKILFTLTRLSGGEKNKGYDKVMAAMKELQGEFPGLKYVLAGKYDCEEKGRLDSLVAQLGLTADVVLAGFISDGDLPAHFQMANVYVMPSQKEGFGIVFIEALYYGLPVIAGNRDGSVDALAGGRFGALVDPDSQDEIKRALRRMLKGGSAEKHGCNDVMKRFGYPVYKEALRRSLHYLFHQKQYPKTKSGESLKAELAEPV